MSDIQTAKQNLENALQEFVSANYGPGHWMQDYIFSVQVVDMTVEGLTQHMYLHDGRGAYHSLRGLTEEQSDYLIDLKMEEKDDAENDN
jgi:hypothetical protein